MTWAAAVIIPALCFFLSAPFMVAASYRVRDSSLRRSLRDPSVRQLAMVWLAANMRQSQMAELTAEALEEALLDFMRMSARFRKSWTEVRGLKGLDVLIKAVVPADHIVMRLTIRKAAPRDRR